MGDSLRSIREVADRIPVGRTMLNELIQRGELRTVKLGRRRFVPDSAIDDFIAKLTEQPAA